MAYKRRAERLAEEAFAAKLEKYIVIGKEMGCAKEQLMNFIKAGVWLQPKQLEIAAKCRECDKDSGPKSIMAGGGRGSAKSHAILAQIFCDDCQRFPGLKVLCLRKIGSTGKEQMDDFCTKLLLNLPHKRVSQPPKVTFDNGSFVILGNFKDEKDIDKYLGLEYDLIYIMESNQLTQTKKINILSCLRSSKEGWRPRCYQDTNPGGIDHAANKVIFVDPWKAGRETETRYVHSTVDDNCFVDKGYKEFLDKLVGWQYKAWRLGDWDFMAGAYFSNFNAGVHIFPKNGKSFDRRNVSRWFAAYDAGFSHNWAFILMAETRDGIKWVVEERCQNQQVIAEQAQEMLDCLETNHLSVADLDYFVGGRDCFARKLDDGTAKTIASTFEEYGISFTPANVDRINGWKVCHQLLGDVSKDIDPKVYIHESCGNLIEQIQKCQHNPLKPGDVEKFDCDEDGNGGDDAVDSWRYCCASDPNQVIKFALPVALSKMPFQRLGF